MKRRARRQLILDHLVEVGIRVPLGEVRPCTSCGEQHQEAA